MADQSPINLNQLRYFYEVARSQNMKRASVRLGVSQPALSKQVQALEDALGLQLFHRSPRGMQPTADGQVVFEHCERVFGHLRDLEEAVDKLRSGSAGRVAIGSVNSIGVHILPLYLRRFRQAHPKVRLKLVTSRSAQVVQALREHRIDIGLVAGEPDTEGLEAEPFLHNPIRVVVAFDHPLARSARRGEPIAPQVLDGLEMVAFDEQAPTRHMTERAFADLDVGAKVVAESSDIEVIKRMVEIGVGFAALPTHCIGRELEAGSLVALEVEGLSLSRDLYVLSRESGALPPAAQHFVDLILGRTRLPLDAAV